MATLSIGDQKVTVDDAFLQLSPADQQSTVQQIASQMHGRAPVGVNDVVRSAATGVPVVGGVLNKLDAATNAVLAPAVEPFLTPGPDSINDAPGATVLDRLKNRYQKSLDIQNRGDAAFEAAHPVVDTAAKLAGGVASMAPVMSAAPAAFGLAGPMSSMVRNGAISGAALSGADAAVRGENPLTAGAVGGIIGGAAGPVGKGVGKVVSAIADRVRPPAPVAQNIAKVGGVEIPLTQAEVSGDQAASAENQIIQRGGRGAAAETNANQFLDMRAGKLDQARQEIAASLDSTGASAATAPNDAAERVASELIAQEQARQAADTANRAAVGQEGQSIARGLGPNAAAPSPVDAAETLAHGFDRAAAAGKADYRGKYAAAEAAPGEFAPGSAAGFRNDVENGLRSQAVDLNTTNTPKALQALDIVDRHMNAAGPGPKLPPAAADPEHAANLADIRAKYGDRVAEAYNRQKTPEQAPHSLLQFIASKGGLQPNPELEAIGLANGHRAQVPGRAGFFGVVNSKGVNIDRMREAAQEAGYLRGAGDATSTPREFLDAIDGELRGQKRYPEGFEGHVTKRESAALSDRAQHEQDQHLQGFETDLAAAGHGDVAPELKARAVHLMSTEGMDADTAIEHSLRQLDQEDAAGLGAGAKRAYQLEGPGAKNARQAIDGNNPVDNAPAGSGFTMRDVENVRKQLSTLYGDARRAMLGGGSGSDLRAVEHIRDQFDTRVEKMLAEGHFKGGDGEAVLKMMQDARASFADYKAKFAKRGSGDTTGAAVEKILGKFSDSRMTPDALASLAYGSASAPGGQMPVQIAQRILSVFGRDSAEFGTYKQGLFSHLTAGEPEKAVARIAEFMTGKGKLLSQTVFTPAERAQLTRHAGRLSSTLPRENAPGAVAATIRRYSGADGSAPASVNKIVSDLYGATGKGSGPISAPLAAHLKQALSKEAWTAVRQGMFQKLTSAGEGKIEFEAQALSQRLHEFLNESGEQLSKVLFSPQELEKLRQLASVYKQMIPVKGTTNPSGTAPMLAKMASGLRHALLPLLGFSHGGLPGAAIAFGADKGLQAIGNANNGAKAIKAFYGPQATRPISPRFSQGLGPLNSGSQPTINQGRRSK